MKLSNTPEDQRLATILDGLGECIENARNKSTVVQAKDGNGGTMSVDKPCPDYATELKCWVFAAHLWGLAPKGNGGGKSTNAQGEDADPDGLAASGEGLFGNGH